MRFLGDAKAFTARVDVRLALFVGGSTFTFASLLVAGLLVFATLEAFEDQDRELREETASIAGPLLQAVGDGHLPSRNPLVGWRLLDAGGHRVASGGRAPAETGTAFEKASLGGALRSGGDDFLRHRQPLAGDRTLETTLSLRHFVGERRELAASAIGVMLPGACGAFLLGIFAARRALAPLRDATAAVRTVDPQRLSARIPTRGVPDDVDALAVAINDVLGRIEWAFGRLASFGADVAHELRTPIHRILNTTEVALLEGGDRRDPEEALQSVRAAAQQMQRTVEQLLLLARGEEGRLSLVRERVALAAVLEKLVELYAPLAEASTQTLELRADESVASVDRALLERAVVNVLENALRHALVGGTVRVTVKAGPDRVVLGIEDSGPGISDEEKERIFERFVRLDPARAEGGAGLGLSIARMIVRLHGGELTAEASELGGAAFWIWLPRGAPDGDAKDAG